ncbi:MAG TPA: 2-dehydropantoate 2-reductase [Baekduia sp.]|uniref:ketopantoate reductase family protein n=1 Tax=Baekduia sp. TaxID=2600305 RepID=UPI002D767880|nr:2-dehydropantoate 2-reductase [Baekduia sp.]HET6507866.1 2-dehydropantoate 2-reductase [Baekduia sp.]
MSITSATIIGAGAMGGIFGARLATAGIDTTFFDVSEPLVARLRTEGVTLVSDGAEDSVPVRGTTDPAELTESDLVAVFVKCFHTEEAVRRAAPAIGSDTTVLTLQNGWGNGEKIAELVDPARLAIGVTYVSGTQLEPGRIGWKGSGPTYVGPWDPGSAGLAQPVVDSLGRAGFDVETAADVRTEIWRKLVLNAATLPTAALTGLAAGSLAAVGSMSELVDAAAREAVAVANAAGHDLDAEASVARIHEVLDAAGPGKASMLQDFEAGRRSEIDVITGAVLRIGADHGVPTPVNQALYALVQGYEHARSRA